jgi:hypothetical protein
MQKAGCAVVRQEHLIAVMEAFLLGCTVLLLVVGCAGTSSEAPKEQAHTEVTKEQAEEDRCAGTRYINWLSARYTTNDVPGCPSGGLLSGTAGADLLAGKKGNDEIRGLRSPGRQFDELHGGLGSDVIYGGPGMDFPDGGQGDDVLYGGDGSDDLSGVKGEDVLYGGDGNDYLDGRDGGRKDTQRDKLYGGLGRDKCISGRLDYVSSSCEVKQVPPRGPGVVRVD